MKEDRPLPLGTRIFVLGEGCGLGTYTGFRETDREGANYHTIEFDGGQTHWGYDGAGTLARGIKADALGTGRPFPPPHHPHLPPSPPPPPPLSTPPSPPLHLPTSPSPPLHLSTSPHLHLSASLWLQGEVER